MKINDLINHLTNCYDLEDQIVVAFWDQSSFDKAENINTAEWNACCEYMEDIDWSSVKESLDIALYECLEQMEDE